VITLDAVVVKVVGSMMTSPSATSIVPLLVKVVDSMVRKPPPPSASIVPLLVKAFP
jgi:hypothetical protein